MLSALFGIYITSTPSSTGMLVCLKVYDAAITFEGYGGVFQKINADQTTDWEVAYSTTTQTAHHDVDYLSNGNIIFPVWEQLLVSDIRLLQKVETAPFRKFPIAVKYYGNMPDIIPSRESKPYYRHLVDWHHFLLRHQSPN